MSRKAYPTDVSDEEWEFVAPHLTLIREDTGQRVHALRDVFDAVRWMGKAGGPWRMLPGRLAGVAGRRAAGQTLDGSGRLRAV